MRAQSDSEALIVWLCPDITLRSESDIDVLVEFEPEHTPGLLKLVGMEIELSERVGLEVDMRTAEDLSRYFRDEVVASARPQYERA